VVLSLSENVTGSEMAVTAHPPPVAPDVHAGISIDSLIRLDRALAALATFRTLEDVNETRDLAVVEPMRVDVSQRIVRELPRLGFEAGNLEGSR
jgi:hypothetical protein